MKGKPQEESEGASKGTLSNDDSETSDDEGEDADARERSAGGLHTVGGCSNGRGAHRGGSGAAGGFEVERERVSNGADGCAA